MLKNCVMKPHALVLRVTSSNWNVVSLISKANDAAIVWLSWWRIGRNCWGNVRVSRKIVLHVVVRLLLSAFSDCAKRLVPCWTFFVQKRLSRHLTIYTHQNELPIFCKRILIYLLHVHHCSRAVYGCWWLQMHKNRFKHGVQWKGFAKWEWAFLHWPHVWWFLAT